jgi:DNA polymerase-3 subunit beta
MKITANAGALASALALAAKLSDDAVAKNIAALAACGLEADGTTLSVTGNVLNFALTLTLPAEGERSGALAVNAAALAALTTTFPSEVAVAIEDHGTSVCVACGKSRYTLATVALVDLPPMPTIGEVTGRVDLAREEAAALFARVSFAVSTEKMRNYLTGVCLHDSDGDLAAVATDAHQLARFTIAGASGLSSDYRLIVPMPAIKIIGKILANKNIERVALSRSKSLFALTATNFSFVSKLIDATFPSYEAIVPAPSGNAVVIDRAELMRALRRVAAVADGHNQHRTAGLRWAAGEAALHLWCHAANDVAADTIAAEVTGSGKVAAQTELLLGVLDTLSGERVSLDCRDGKGPIRITDPKDDREFLALVMPTLDDRAAARAARAA